MKTQQISNRPRSGGYAMLLTLFMAAVSITLLVATMSRLTGDANLNARSGQYNASLFAAEAAVERVVAQMQYDYYNGGEYWVTNNLGLYRSMYPGADSAEAAATGNYWSNFQFMDAQGHANQTYVSCTQPRQWGSIQSQWPGLSGWTTVFRVLSNAKQTNGRFSLTNAVQEDIELDSIPVFQFAVFYNGLMEYTWCATFAVNGRTHANGNIFISAATNATLTFNSLVTTTGGVYKTNWDNHTAASMGPTIFATNNAANTPGYTTNVAVLQLPLGSLSNTPALDREIIQMPPATGDTNSALALQRYYNKAGVVVLVSNTSITVSLKTSMTDTPTNLVELFSPAVMSGTNSLTNRYTSTNFPWLTLSSNAFLDYRENSKKVKLTDIDVGVLKDWLPTNAFIASKFSALGGQYPNIWYVADLRDQASTTELTAVRLKNGAIIPTNQAPTGPTGWTFSTPNPLYVKGHYNLGPGGPFGTNDTSKTYPASLVSDALTILSTSWTDIYGVTNANLGARNATATTVNAALLTGIVFSNPTDWTDTNHFSGGVMNLPRLLEVWTGDVLTLNTSIVNLFDSLRATTQFQNPGVYYQAPTRAFTFDNNFTNYYKLPPGTPVVAIVNRANWRVPPPGVTNYAGR